MFQLTMIHVNGVVPEKCVHEVILLIAQVDAVSPVDRNFVYCVPGYNGVCVSG